VSLRERDFGHHNTLHHPAPHCNILQGAVTGCSTLPHNLDSAKRGSCGTMRARFQAFQHTATHCNTLQHAATYCNMLQHTSTHCHTTLARHAGKISGVSTERNTLQHTVPRCNILQHIATYCNTQPHTATLMHTLPYTATHCNTHCNTTLHCKIPLIQRRVDRLNLWGQDSRHERESSCPNLTYELGTV